jgi:hypothetical protein
MRRGGSLVADFEAAGFTLARQKNHQVWRCPCGRHQVVTHCSPCGGRAHANALAQIARTLRECAQTVPEGKAA